MIVKGAVGFSGAKQLLQPLGTGWQRGQDGVFVPPLSGEGWEGVGGGCSPPAWSLSPSIHCLWLEPAPWMSVPNSEGCDLGRVGRVPMSSLMG